MREGIKDGSAARSCTGCQWRRRARRRLRGGRGKKEQRGKGPSARNSRITLPEILTAARNSSAPLGFAAKRLTTKRLNYDIRTTKRFPNDLACKN